MSYSCNDKVGVKVNCGRTKTDNICKPEKCICADVTATTLNCCENSTVNFPPIRTGAVAKIPVVLAELEVQINLDSIIELPEPAIEIKDIKKHLKITQCILLQDTNMLFIKGFVRKNIDYSTIECSNYKGICGDIKHCTIDVPFKCTTPIVYNGMTPEPITYRNSSEFEYFRKQDLSGPEFADKDKQLSGDRSEFNQMSTEFFNELPFCELVGSRIIEFDELLNPVKPQGINVPFEERVFRKIEEKMVIFLTIKVLQNRQVAIGPTVDSDYPCYIASNKEDCE